MDKDSDPGSGAALGALSAAKNKKLMAGVGAALIVVGIAGMIYFGSEAITTITGGGFSSPQQGESFQLIEYVFLFSIVAGTIILAYALVSLQRAHAPRQEPSRRDSQSDADTAAA